MLTVDDEADVIFTDWSGVQDCVHFEPAGTFFVCQCCDCRLKDNCPVGEDDE